MQEETMNLGTFLPALQSVLNAPGPDELRSAVHAVNGHLAIVPVEQVLSQAGKLTDFAEQHLMDAIENNMDLILPHTKRACEIAYRDWKLLRRPILPAPIMTSATRKALGIVKSIYSLGKYEAERQDMWAQLQAIDDGEQETVSGYLSRKLAEQLIRKMLPELVRQKDDPALIRQFRLWRQLIECRQHGLDNLAVYFLQIKGNYVHVLLPPAMQFHHDVKEYYGCARTLAVLYHQIPACQREVLFRSPLLALEDEVMHRVLQGEASESLDAIQDLYYALRTEERTRQLYFWETICYTKHDFDKNTKEAG